MGKGKGLVPFSPAVDESNHISDTAVSLHPGSGLSLCATEELWGLKSVYGPTTGKEIFEEVSKCVTEIKLLWNPLMGLTRDGVPAMCGPKRGAVSRVQEKMREENCASELTVYHCITHQ